MAGNRFSLPVFIMRPPQPKLSAAWIPWLLVLVLILTSPGEAGGAPAPVRPTVRDRLWAWAHEAGVYNGNWGLPGPSRITPAEGAAYLGVPNIIFIRYLGKPAPPFEQYAIPFRPFTRVYWSITGASGATSRQERDHVFQLASAQTNIVGVFMDDFFDLDSGKAAQAAADNATAAPAALSVAELQDIRRRLQVGERKLDLGVTLYTHQLTPRVRSHLDLCDVVSLWTWKAGDLKDLEANFEKLRALMPGKRVLLGCYLWDFGTGKPMPLDRMKLQCELGLRWLKQGRVEGMIFLATNVCDLNLETVEWTRAWIARVGVEAL